MPFIFGCSDKEKGITPELKNDFIYYHDLLDAYMSQEKVIPTDEYYDFDSFYKECQLNKSLTLDDRYIMSNLKDMVMLNYFCFSNDMINSEEEEQEYIEKFKEYSNSIKEKLD